MNSSLWKKSLPYRILFFVCMLILSIISLIIGSTHLSNCYLTHPKPTFSIDPTAWLIYSGSYGIAGTVLIIGAELFNKSAFSMLIQIIYVIFFEIWGMVGLVLYAHVRTCTRVDDQIIVVLVNIITWGLTNIIMFQLWYFEHI